MRNDLAFISQKTEGFRLALKELVEKIQVNLKKNAVLTKDSIVVANEEQGDAEMDRTKLMRLKDALENYDIKVIDGILKDLGKIPFDKGTRDIISDISDSVLLSDFNRALGMTGILLERTGK
jgi:hypothetical protein